MPTINNEIPLRIYQKLSLMTKEVTIRELADLCDLAEEDVSSGLEDLEKRKLISKSDQIVRAVPWWNEDHLELLVNIPRVDPSSFQNYARGLDSFCEELQSEGFHALRPYAHETGIEIILGTAAAFALAEFAKGFLGELGKKLAGFVGKTVKRDHEAGITEVEVKAVRHWKGAVDLMFSVKGRDEESVLSSFKELLSAIEKLEKKAAKAGELRESGSGWELVLRKSK
jgi:DNA-binding Lrp family transcriptional regulator